MLKYIEDRKMTVQFGNMEIINDLDKIRTYISLEAIFRVG